MTTATLARPSFRTDRDGVPIRRVVVPARAEVASLTNGEVRARLSILKALCFTVGVLTWNLAPFVGWGRGLVDSVTLVAAVAASFIIARSAAPYVVRGLHAVRALDRSLSWWIGMAHPARDGWLPPLPSLPLVGSVAVIPYHGSVTRGGVIVRRTRLARHVDWVLIFDHSHVVAVARVTGQSRNHPGVIARRHGPQTGLTATAYRTYTKGHVRAYAIHTDLAYTLTRPITLAEVGITGPLGSHRYVGGAA